MSKYDRIKIALITSAGKACSPAEATQPGHTATRAVMKCNHARTKAVHGPVRRIKNSGNTEVRTMGDRRPVGQRNEQPTTTAWQGKAATTASEHYRLTPTKM